MDHITIRKKMQRTKSEDNISILNISNDRLNSTFLDSTMLSLQNDSQNTCMDELKTELEYLRQKLNSADIEIDHLNIENEQLKRTILEQSKQIDLLKKLTKELPSTPANTCTSAKTPINKRLFNIKMHTSRISTVHLAKSTWNNMHCTPPRLGSIITKDSDLGDIAKSKTINDDTTMTITPPKQILSNPKPTQSTPVKHRVIILSDNQGRNVRHQLQNLLGSHYEVTSFMKPNASLGMVVTAMKEEINNLTMNDYVILLAGSNDKNPFEFSSKLEIWLSSIRNTNVIVGEIPRNLHLHEKKLNYELKFHCHKFDNVIFVDLNYSREMPKHNMFALHIARSMLKEILGIFYKRNKENYNILCTLKNKQGSFKHVSTQTTFTSIYISPGKNDCSHSIGKNKNSNICISKRNFVNSNINQTFFRE